MSEIRAHLPEILKLVSEADAAVMDIYNSFDLDTVTKDDDTPQTRADRDSHSILFPGLQRIMPDVPVVSEEGGETQNRRIVTTTSHFIALDPIDGTKNFIAHDGQFVICFGEIINNKIAYGVASVPALGVTYYGGPDFGSFKIEHGEDKPIHVAPEPTHVVMASNTRSEGPTEQYIAEHFAGFRLKTLGSLLKFIEIAEGKADAFPRVNHTMKIWDVAAGHAILEGAGGTVTRPDGSPLDYTDEDFLIGDFVAHS